MPAGCDVWRQAVSTLPRYMNGQLVLYFYIFVSAYNVNFGLITFLNTGKIKQALVTLLEMLELSHQPLHLNEIYLLWLAVYCVA